MLANLSSISSEVIQRVLFVPLIPFSVSRLLSALAFPSVHSADRTGKGPVLFFFSFLSSI
ncbi:hypothetical protein CSUI_005611 [Cystoisospora suis]|uniref:Uncharacterized protein n=1 Tax=Cystoisospora suis TaxID=483139 RepID=A0A2C6K536_9APIC|nr:hypothetical protein CSUI_005611 [Cystoisospora suis]